MTGPLLNPVPCYSECLTVPSAVTRLLVSLDIDGTLTDVGRVMPSVTVSAVAAARAVGHHIVLATGRSLVGMLPVVRALGITTGWTVTSSGAVVVRLDPAACGGYVIEEAFTFDVEPVARLLHEIAPHLTLAVEELGQGYRTNVPVSEAILHGRRRVVRFEEIWRRPTTRALVWGAGVHGLAERLRDLGLTVTSMDRGGLDITPAGLTKATALETIRRTLGVDSAHTLAVGDSYNDIDMLRWAARSVAMGQAPAEIASVAREVTGTVAENGVVEVLRSITPPTRCARGCATLGWCDGGEADDGRS